MRTITWKQCRTGVVSALVALLSVAAVHAQQVIPQIEATSLAGHAMRLPRDLPPGLSVLVMGFTRGSGDGSKEWGRTLHTLVQNGGSFAYFQTPVMVSLPRLIRGMVLGDIRKSVPVGEQDRFLPIFDHEQEWKHTVSYTAPDDCYLLVVDQQGVIRWQTHGPPTPEHVVALQKSLAH